jgi:myo-inositol 2-dehydrogenase/D-chiro-inositol 1-dehydrogenase
MTGQDIPVRVGVLGVGRIGRMHARLLAHQVPGASLGMVFDVNPDLAKGVADELDVPAAGSAEEVFGAPELDAVAICTSTDTHVDLLVAAATSGKAIFCEKPVSLDLAEVDRALAAIDAAGAPLQIGFNRRFDPAHRSVRDAVAEE